MLYAVIAALLADPVAIPAYAVLTLSALMYPLGFMLGSQCSACCTPCGCPVGEVMPEAVTVTFSGLTQNAFKVSDLLSLSFDSCFGSGASGTVEATGGLPNQGGPIQSVTLTGGGSGYAVLGRVEPEGLTITGSGGDGAEFAITLQPTIGDCGLPVWAVKSVEVTKQAEGYSEGEFLVVTLGPDETEEAAASLVLHTVASEPTLLAIVTAAGPGNGAQLSVAAKKVSEAPDRWGVDTVTVLSGGAFYYDQEPVAVYVNSPDIQISAAVAKARTRRDAPSIVYDYKTGPGSGATFSTTVTQIAGVSPKAYEVSSATGSGGSGYQVGRYVYFKNVYNPRTTMLAQAQYEITAVSPTGAILSLSKVNGGWYFTDSGVVESVEVTSPGSYFGPSTTAGTVEVLEGGRYYKTSTEVPALVASVAVSVVQQEPSVGTGAVIAAVVDGVLGSPTFGSVIGLTITNGGTNYVKWSYLTGPCCTDRLNDSVVLCKRQTPTSCNYVGACCFTADVVVSYKGKDALPTVTLNGGNIDRRYCRVTFEGKPEDAPFACESMDFVAYDVFGGEAHVEAAPATAKKKDYPCPPCCSKHPDNDYSCYSQSECAENDGDWLTKCECSGCLGCDTAQSLIVTVTLSVRWYKIDTSVHYPLGFNPPGVPEFYNVVAGQFVDDVQEHTITLNAENSWSDVTGDWIPPSCQVCYDGTGASAFLGDSADTETCTVYAKAWADWIEGYVLACSFNQTYAPDGSLNPQWCQIFKTSQYKPIFALSGNALLPNPLYFRGGGVRIPNADGCFTGGAERTTVYENWWFDQPASITVSVTVAT